MKLSEIEFDDAAFKDVVMATDVENAEELVELRARNKSIKSAKGIEYFINLKFLDLTRNLLQTLDISNNPLIEELYVGNNQLESLDTSHLTELRELEFFMNDISVINLGGSPKLENIYANANDLCELDLSTNLDLIEIQVSDNNLKSILLAADNIPDILLAENNKLPEDLKSQLQGRGVKTLKL